MMRNLKALMLAAMAVLAMSAVAATAAQAEVVFDYAFESNAESTTLSATSDGTAKNSHHVLDFAGGSITCNSVQFDAAVSGKVTTEITINPVYLGCTFAGQAATINFHSCDYLLTSNETLHIAGVNCASDPITFSIPNPPCSVSFGPQAISNALTYTNVKPGANEEITIDLHMAGIHYSAVGTGCPIAGTNTNGNFTTGNTILTGTNTATGTMTNIRWKA